jgi:O-antigen/teichoic acid export membrane protein
MSRAKRFAHSLVSGYLLLGVNILYTLVQGRMLLHYIHSDNEVGLWAVAIQMAGYLLLLDLGMSGSVARILVDHKDDAQSTAYGATIKTGFVVLLLQGLLVAVGGIILSRWLPELIGMTRPAAANPGSPALTVEQVELFRSLFMWQCILIGGVFAGKMFGFILESHQRYDVTNYAQTTAFVVNLLTLWWSFEHGWGLYSLLWSNLAGFICVNLISCVMVWRLRFFPGKGRWGHVSSERFRELFSYATDIFLLTVGNMLITASQVVVVGWTLGVAAAGVWTFTTKTFAMAQQLIARIYNYSSSAFSEMFVRGELERLRTRFRDLVVLTAAVGAWVTLSVALCNFSFLKVWTGNRMTWGLGNDFLMAVYILTFTTTRCHVGLVCITKELRGMKAVYLAEGLAFVGLAWGLGRWFGFAGIILAGILTNLSFSGLYGVRRTSQILRVPVRQLLCEWMGPPLRFLLVMLAIAVVFRYLTLPLPVVGQLIANAAIATTLGLVCLWKLGLPENLQQELSAALKKAQARFQRVK